MSQSGSIGVGGSVEFGEVTPMTLAQLQGLVSDDVLLSRDTDLNHDGTNAGLYGKAPVAQAAKIADPAGGVTIDAEARTGINAIIDALEGIGITANV